MNPLEMVDREHVTRVLRNGPGGGLPEVLVCVGAWLDGGAHPDLQARAQAVAMDVDSSDLRAALAELAVSSINCASGSDVNAYRRDAVRAGFALRAAAFINSDATEMDAWRDLDLARVALWSKAEDSRIVASDIASSEREEAMKDVSEIENSIHEFCNSFVYDGVSADLVSALGSRLTDLELNLEDSEGNGGPALPKMACMETHFARLKYRVARAVLDTMRRSAEDFTKYANSDAPWDR